MAALAVKTKVAAARDGKALQLAARQVKAGKPGRKQEGCRKAAGRELPGMPAGDADTKPATRPALFMITRHF